MDTNNVAELERIIKQGIVSIGEDGHTYSPAKMYRIFDDREIKPIRISNLTGLVDYVENRIDTDFKNDNFIVVEHQNFVSLVSCIQKDTRARNRLVEVVALERMIMSFGQYIEVENFIIALKTMFVNTADQERLISFVSKLTSKNQIEVADDGITQQATVVRGVSGALRAQEMAPSIVNLAPYRTFDEIEQPMSPFMFRIRNRGDEAPLCTLFTADGGAWRQEAMYRIKEYLNKKIPDMVVIA